MMNHAVKTTLLALATATVLVGTASAAPQTMFASAVTANDPGATRDAFMRLATGVVSEGFESAATGRLGGNALSVFAGFGALTQPLGGRASIEQGLPTNGRSNTTPGACNATSTCKWFETATAFNIKLNEFRSAFGFFATDVGDAGGAITLDLWNDGANGSTNVRSGIAVSQPNQFVGLTFFGFIDDQFTFNRITVNVSQTAANPTNFDYIGFDDVLSGNRAGATTPVSAPASLALSLLGLGLLGATRRRATAAAQ